MRARFWLPAAALAALLLAGAAAARPQSDAAWRLVYLQSQNIVEQQTPGGATQPDPTLWVTDPTGCVWDVDEVTRWQASGILTAGASISVQGCLVADWGSHISRLHTSTGGVSLSLTVGGISVSADSTVCVEGPEYDRAAVLPVVDGSNGGVGVLTTVTFTATNNTSKRLRNVLVTGEIGYSYGDPSSGPHPCPVFGPRQGVYPGPWWRIAR